MSIDYQREMLAYAEKIALAELEESKAAERVYELKYHQARFNLDYFLQVQKERQPVVDIPPVGSPNLFAIHPPPPPPKRLIIEGERPTV